MFCFSIINCCFGMVVMGAEGTNLAKYVLDKMLENRNKVENFKCAYEKLTYYSEKERQATYEDLLKAGLPQEQAKEGLNQAYSYQTEHLALDNKDCGRVETIAKEVDTRGNLTGKIEIKRITIWDGKNSIDYREEPKSSYADIGATEPSLPVTKRYSQPWRTFGGNFCDYLKSALERNEKVNIEKQKDGKYWIEFLYSEDTKMVGLIDPNQGYSMISRETYSQEHLQVTYKAQFKEVKPGIWFPVSGECISGSLKDPLSTNTMTVKEIKINDPNFYDGLFKVDFKEGTRVTDMISGLNYVVSEQ
jgi:hypothetical protein